MQISPEPQLMFDIETLGTEPGSVVLSLGAVVFRPTFDPANEVEFLEEIYAEFSMAEQFDAGLTCDPETLKWWFQQAIAPPLDGINRLHQIASEIEARASKVGANRIVWANPPSFDAVLFRAALKATEAPTIDCIDYSWLHHRHEYDLRMIKRDSAQMGTESINYGPRHNALVDAKWQAHMLCRYARTLAI